MGLIDGESDMSGSKPRVAMDTYVLAQGIKTGVYRVCDEIFRRLAKSAEIEPLFLVRDGFEASTAAYIEASGLNYVPTISVGDAASADILLSPFGVAPASWLQSQSLIHAHIIYDLIALKNPGFFSVEAATEVKSIVDSIDEETIVFAISSHTKEDLLSERPDLSPSSITVVPLAADAKFRQISDEKQIASTKEKYGIPNDMPYFLSVATLEIRKNLSTVVEAFACYCDSQPDNAVALVLSGMSGWKLEEFNRALLAARRWRHRIFITGYVEDEDLAALYSGATAFIYLSRYEGFGLPPLEAMACGVPVICANNSSLPEVVGKSGILVDADDVDGAATAMAELVSTSALRLKLEKSGKKRASTFNWDLSAGLIVERLTSAYAKSLHRPKNRRRRPVFPGEHISSVRTDDGRLQADFRGYFNGSFCPPLDPSLLVGDQVSDAAMLKWRDMLAEAGSKDVIQGGRRLRGDLKNPKVNLPLVSYITVVKNNEAAIGRAIESVMSQTYANVEHIVLDGNSADGTLEVIKKYEKSLDYYVSEEDEGLYEAINKAVSLARGDIICILNSDDWLEPDAAEIAASRLKPYISEGALMLAAARVKSPDTDIEWYPDFVTLGSYFRCANDCHNAIYATRTAYELSDPYDTRLKIASDFKWIMNCYEKGVTFVYTREATVNYSLGGTSGDVTKHSLECMKIVSERFPYLTDDEVKGIYDCFFVFRGRMEPLLKSPEQKSDFIRSIFARYPEKVDLLLAIGWASIYEMEFSQPGTVYVRDEFSFKHFVRDKLKGHPLAFKIAKSVAALMRLR